MFLSHCFLFTSCYLSYKSCFNIDFLNSFSFSSSFYVSNSIIQNLITTSSLLPLYQVLNHFPHLHTNHRPVYYIYRTRQLFWRCQQSTLRFTRRWRRTSSKHICNRNPPSIQPNPQRTTGMTRTIHARSIRARLTKWTPWTALTHGRTATKDDQSINPSPSQDGWIWFMK